jgi:hypothetical protein
MRASSIGRRATSGARVAVRRTTGNEEVASLATTATSAMASSIAAEFVAGPGMRGGHGSEDHHGSGDGGSSVGERTGQTARHSQYGVEHMGSPASIRTRAVPGLDLVA